ncbi:hypothetical protein CCO03_09870 [Comamonas serinivorans]|uniref:Radical SAM core domain-containing protein n=1 Tax=Comamonas serinivorans TaxID=1082851 RepID=A0A1Y0ETS1_9BURK|nr:PA0069 family radical SAM protein [Comamonas serinivorans]ARU06771.1 hypothetical protein CCO03_09870 [Comamonas serinivorans]
MAISPPHTSETIPRAGGRQPLPNEIAWRREPEHGDQHAHGGTATGRGGRREAAGPPLKGRGAVGNVVHRFAQTRTEAVDDGWAPLAWLPSAPQAGVVDGEDGPAGGPDPDIVQGGDLNERLSDEGAMAVADADADLWGPAVSWRTEVTAEWAKSVITRNRSPDLPFDQSLNPYRGCEHGCIYCFARPTHSYLGLSPGLDFERRIVAKTNVAECLARELDSPRYRPRPLVIGTVTDAYQPIERELGLTRRVLEGLVARRHPFSIITKGAAVERDLDLIAPMAAQGLASVYVTVTSLDGALIRKLEPRAASPARRLRTIRTLAAAGVPVGVSVAPQIPFLNDDMEQVLAAAREAGAGSAFYTVLRLPWELVDVFQDWLHAHFPDRAARVMARVQDLRGGRLNDARFGSRMQGQGLWADLLAQRFARACRQLGLNQRAQEDDMRLTAWPARGVFTPRGEGDVPREVPSPRPAQPPQPRQGSLF